MDARKEIMQSRSLIVINLNDCSDEDQKRVRKDISSFICRKLTYVNNSYSTSAANEPVQYAHICLNTIPKTRLI